MSLTERLNGIRSRPGSTLTKQEQLLRVFLAFTLGATMGLLAKHTDSVSVLGDIGTHLGIWVLVATVLAAWSRSPQAAALHVFAFFAGLLGAYYAYSAALFGFFPRHYFLFWGGVALLSPIAACAVWYARGDGWLAALCASLPVALLLSEGRAFHYTLAVPQGFACLSALLLWLALPANRAQRLRMIPFVVAVFLLITRLGLTNRLFGGW